MTKMKRVLGLALLLLGTSILVGCSSTPTEEPAKPKDAASGPPSGGGTAPGTNASAATKVKPE